MLFDKIASKFYEESKQTYINRIINLLYRFKYDLIAKYDNIIETQLLNMSLNLRKRDQTYNLVGLSEAETYYSVRRFLNKHKFINTIVPIEIDFQLSENQQGAFLAACETVPQFMEELLKISEMHYRMRLEPKQAGFALSQHSAFRPYQGSSKVNSKISIVKT